MGRRLTVDLSDEQGLRMDRLMMWGVRGKVISILLDEVMDVIEKHGNVVIGAFLSGNVKILDAIKAAQEKKDEPRKP
jgi:hypothetical protein